MLRGRLPSQLGAALDTTDGYVRALAASTGIPTEEIAAGTDRDSEIESIAYEGRRLTFFSMMEMDDKLVHRPLPEHIRREKIRQYLRDIADALGSAAELIERRCPEAPTVAIVGDHGYTCLGRDVGRGILIADGVKATHGRAAYPPVGHPADSVAVLQAEDFMLREEVAVARSYHYFEPRPRGAVHGGMTPQELAVPLIVVSTVQPESLRDLEIIVSGSVIRGRRENEIEIKVTNSNRQGALLQSLRLRLTRIVSTIPAEIPAEGMHTITAVVDGSSVTSSEIVLSGAMHWKAAGREQTTHVEARVSTQGAAATEQEFERLFE